MTAYKVTLLFKGLDEPVIIEDAVSIKYHNGEIDDLEKFKYLKDYPYTLISKTDSGYKYFNFVSSDLIYLKIN